MSTLWRCGVCEGVNNGGRACATCGAVLPRRAALATAVRGELQDRRPVQAVRDRLPQRPRRAAAPPPGDGDYDDAPRFPPRRFRRAAEPVPFGYGDDASFDLEEPGVEVRPLPGGCLVSVGPKRRRRA